MQRAVTYARVSTDRQAEHGTSLAAQRERCLMFITANEWALVGEYEDRGVSGKRESRPQLDQLIEACRSGQVDAVVVAKLDRLGRSVRNISNLIHELDALDVRLVLLDVNVDTSTPTGRLLLNILSAVAELEASLIAERMLGGRQAVAALGYWTGGVLPYGFTSVPVEGTKHSRLAVNEDEAHVIRMAAAAILDDTPTSHVSNMLNALGHKPRKTDRWNYQLLHHVLTKDDLVPGILDAETFAAVQRLVHDKRLGRRAKDHVYPLSHRLVGACGAPYAGLYRKERDQRWYTCAGRRSLRPKYLPESERCDDSRLRADVVEQSVWWALVNFFEDESALLQLAEREWFSSRTQRESVSADRAKAAALVVELEERLGTQMELLLDEGLDAKVVAARCAQRNDELQAARAYLTKCEAGEIASADRELRLDALRTARVALSLLKPSPEQQKRLYDALDLRVQLTAEGRLAITAELGLAVEVAANGASSPEELLAEMIAKPFR